jgi:hypothetical protein
VTVLGVISLVGSFVLVLGLDPYEPLKLPRKKSWYKCEALSCTYFEEGRLREGRIFGHPQASSPA